jgi:RND family efflux transporter MFP subunit
MNGIIKRAVIILSSSLMILHCNSGKTDNDENSVKVPVEVQTVQPGNLVQSIFYGGDIFAEFEVDVFSKIPDRIEKYFVDEGDYIKKGAPIARIIATTIEQAARQSEAAVIAAKAQEANLRVEYERAQRLYRESAMSQQQFDLIKTQYEANKAQVEQAEAALTSARSQFKDATVSAPISGIIGKRYFESGDMANMMHPLVKIVQMDRLKIIVNAIEDDLGKVAVGQEAKITVRSFPDRIFIGKVTKISPILDPLTRMADVEIMLDNKDHSLKPGMYAEVEIIFGIMENVITVPRFATIESTTMETVEGKDQVIKNYYVYLVRKGKAVQTKLDITYFNHKNIAVSSAVVDGDSLVIAGQNNLRDGMAVRIVKERGEIL